MALKTVITVRSKVNRFFVLLFFDFVFWLLVLKPAIQLKKR
jgi:hypothetical protein